MNKPLSNQIESFWKWFNENIQVITEVIEGEQHPKTEWVVEQLNTHVLGMGHLKWEVGNPNPTQFSFMLSPNGDRELLVITKAIIANAPRLANWSFYASIQQNGQPSIEIYDNNMEIQKVDASDWKAALFSSPEGRKELILDISEDSLLDEDTELIAIDILLNNIIGEEQKVTCLAGFDFFGDDYEDKNLEWFPFKSLPQHI